MNTKKTQITAPKINRLIPVNTEFKVVSRQLHATYPSSSHFEHGANKNE